jgi:hypothetical protein
MIHQICGESMRQKISLCPSSPFIHPVHLRWDRLNPFPKQQQ